MFVLLQLRPVVEQLRGPKYSEGLENKRATLGRFGDLERGDGHGQVFSAGHLFMRDRKPCNPKLLCKSTDCGM
ncbi:hypothetical protein B6N38_11400 [Cutibacterium avidum]|nr:hypothetical protein PALO_00135 [Cutibacterium avidum 44067]ERF58222.1 hypothetical protein H639_04409 [Cutibacterium avidum TM16]KXA67772.1 hypothetical protein HMPREF3223_00093 [Cutibacterium avidum]OIJ79906.1 hypothetical protein APY06_11405 [Cutibacterium avidum]PGX67879.1 hypothetical protein B6N39_08800 [Cutibacterium avidum]